MFKKFFKIFTTKFHDLSMKEFILRTIIIGIIECGIAATIVKIKNNFAKKAIAIINFIAITIGVIH